MSVRQNQGYIRQSNTAVRESVLSWQDISGSANNFISDVTIGRQGKTPFQAGRFYTGQISEMIWFRDTLSKTSSTYAKPGGGFFQNMEIVDCYFSTKYGINITHTCP